MQTTDTLVKAIEDDDFISFLMMYREHKNINSPAKNGMTPLIASIHFDRFNMFLELVNYDEVDKHATDSDGYDPLYHAVRTNNFICQLELS